MNAKRFTWKVFLDGVAYLLFFIGGMACLDGWIGRGEAVSSFTRENRLSAEIGDLCVALLCAILGVIAMYAANSIQSRKRNRHDGESLQK